MSERILDFDAADVLAKQQAQTESMADGGPAYVVAFPPAYRAALEAQAQAALTAATELKHGDLYENFRQARFRYERAEAKLARVQEYANLCESESLPPLLNHLTEMLNG